MQRVRILFCPLSERRAAPYGTGHTNVPMVQASHINQLILGRDARLNCSRPRNRCAGWLAAGPARGRARAWPLHDWTVRRGAARRGDRDARKTIEAATTPLEYLVHRIPSRCTCEMWPRRSSGPSAKPCDTRRHAYSSLMNVPRARSRRLASRRLRWNAATAHQNIHNSFILWERHRAENEARFNLWGWELFFAPSISLQAMAIIVRIVVTLGPDIRRILIQDNCKKFPIFSFHVRGFGENLKVKSIQFYIHSYFIFSEFLQSMCTTEKSLKFSIDYRFDVSIGAHWLQKFWKNSWSFIVQKYTCVNFSWFFSRILLIWPSETLDSDVMEANQPWDIGYASPAYA